jgi:PIN domain nuclease of toxin-antitoxin system
MDTHVLVWVGQGDDQELSPAAFQALDENDIVVSPAVVLELEFLRQIGRLRLSPEKLLEQLESQIGLRVCDLQFQEVVSQALRDPWTREPFDLLIVANAQAANAPLVTKDRRIRKHYRQAIW